MTTLALRTPATTATAPRAYALPAVMRRLLDAWQLRQHCRQTRRELSWLSDRELADLGILRCDIDRLARQATYGA